MTEYRIRTLSEYHMETSTVIAADRTLLFSF